jgi:hypothetical protein
MSMGEITKNMTGKQAAHEQSDFTHCRNHHASWEGGGLGARPDRSTSYRYTHFGLWHPLQSMGSGQSMRSIDAIDGAIDGVRHD